MTSGQLTPPLAVLLAAGAGLSVAALYYNQPILAAIGQDLHATPAQVGRVPTLTQLGYGTGIVLSAPLGDRFDRRPVIVGKLLALSASLLAAALAPSLWCLEAASLAAGLFATAAQDFIPAAATLAPPASRGRDVGRVMTGVLLGILLSRFVSGVVGANFGWRGVFLGAAAATTLLVVIVARRLPPFVPEASAPYGSLLRSIASLAVSSEPLRRAAIAQGLLSVAFSGFWSTLALVLAAAPYHLGSAAAGAFGLAGAAGALAAPLAGRISDARGPVTVIRVGAGLVAASFAAMGLWQGSVSVLIAGTVAFDLGVQGCLVSHQTIVFGLDPSARSRLNAVLVSTMFLGMAAGSALASHALAHYGWTGVMVMGATAAGAALLMHTRPPSHPPSPNDLAQRKPIP